MQPKLLIPWVLLSLAAQLPALTEDGKVAGEELLTAIKDEANKLADIDPGNNRDHSARYLIRQIQAALATGNNRQIEQLLESTDVKLSSEKSAQGFAKLKTALKAERDQKSEATIARMETLLKTTRDKIAQAKSPDELDGVLEELSKNATESSNDDQGNESSNARIRRLYQQTSSAKQFTIYWQDYLQAKKSGNTRQATNSLQSLTNQENSLMPRSQLLARIEQEKSTPEAASPVDAFAIVDGIKSLDDMQAALKSLFALQQAARSSDTNSNSLNDYVQSIGRLEKCYREFLAGLPVNVEVFSQSSDSSNQVTKVNLIRLRAELLVRVLPRSIGIPEAASAIPGETVQQFFERVLAEAKDCGDAAACQRIKETQQTFARGSRYSTEDTTGLRDYAASQNQVAAGQFMLAVISLQKSLKSGSDLLPARKIGVQLAAIQKDYPKEYEQGMTEFLTPRPMPEYMGGMPYRGFADPRSRYMGGDPNMQPPGTSVLLPVPAKEPAAPPKPESKKTPTEAAPDKQQAPALAIPE